jgi:purine-nucleoside phosphorylase
MLQTAATVRQRLEDTCRAIEAQTRFRPEIGLILGSGLGALASAVRVEAEFDYAQLPHMPQATAPGHEGRLTLGTLGARRVAVLSGRFHYYEGHSSEQIIYPVRLLHALGAKALILTSIVGSMNRAMPPGGLVLLEDHINLMGVNPLTGPNDESVGPRFPDMSEPYDPVLRALTLEVGKAQGLPVRPGVYVAVAGPNLETKAEYRFLRQAGADVVGMSVVPEVIAARHAGLRVLAVVVVSDACDPDDLKPASIEELLRIAGEAEPKLTALLRGVIERVEV